MKDNPILNILSIDEKRFTNDNSFNAKYVMVITLRKNFYLKLFEKSPDLEKTVNFPLTMEKDIDVFFVNRIALRDDYQKKGFSSLDNFIDSIKLLESTKLGKEGKFKFKNSGIHSFVEVKFSEKFVEDGRKVLSEFPLPNHVLMGQLYHYKRSGFITACK